MAEDIHYDERVPDVGMNIERRVGVVGELEVLIALGDRRVHRRLDVADEH